MVKISFFLGISYASLSAELEDGLLPDGQPAQTLNIVSRPLSLNGTFVLYNEPIALHFGLGLGADFAKAEYTDRNSNTTEKSDTGFAFDIPIGLWFFLSEHLYLHLGYTWYYTSENPFSNDFVHFFAAGIGLQF